MIASELRSTRLRFFRQLGVGLAAGVGALAIPKAARADVWVCCPAFGSQCQSEPPCSGSQVHFYCRCSEHGGSDYCTGCQPNGNCYNGPC
jgi:hypothetical protein